MNDEQAATKIQKTFRGHSSRKKLKKEKQSVIKIQKVYRGHHTRRIIAKQEQSALKIQKVFRGHVERKKFLKVRPKVIILKEEPASDVGTTLAIIKPDAVAKGLSDAIKLRIRDEGFTIVQEKLIQLNRTSAEEFYAEHYGKPFFERLTTFMSSGPVRVLILSRANAIKAWRQLMGPTNVTTAKQQAPTSLRALFGNESESTNNAVHGSDSEASAQREIHFFFPTRTTTTIVIA